MLKKCLALPISIKNVIFEVFLSDLFLFISFQSLLYLLELAFPYHVLLCVSDLPNDPWPLGCLFPCYFLPGTIKCSHSKYTCLYENLSLEFFLFVSRRFC